jgi:DNA-binding NtrC family response regulator
MGTCRYCVHPANGYGAKVAKPVLISWLAVNNDPYERVRSSHDYRLLDGAPIPGPTLTLLFDQESPYCGQIGNAVLLYRHVPGSAGDGERDVLRETIAAIRERNPQIKVESEAWASDDPTDHKNIFEFLQNLMPKLRSRFLGRELLIHISPGTPSMQTIWVLMGETGLIEAPVKLVKSYRPSDRHGKAAVVPVEVGIETFYKSYMKSRPSQGVEDQILLWNPAKFQSASLRSLFDEARRVAHLKVPVLILGERGTGKTTLAAWIRMNSPYRRPEQDSHWPSVACGQYNHETMRSELFGYRKGAFTGAQQDKDGILHVADRDTLFLDEIGDISRDLQRLLIRALEEKRFFPLGDDKPRKSDFRLLTATNLPMHTLADRLDPDFFDRIGVLTLAVPSVREMPEDIEWLWASVYQHSQARSGVEKSRCVLPKSAHKEITAALRSSPLLGNLRDLFRVAYRLLAALGDPLAPMTASDAVAYGLHSLRQTSHSSQPMDLTREIAQRFSRADRLDDLLATGTRLPTVDLDRRFKRFVATELRRIAKVRGVPVAELCDVSDRTLRSWASPAEEAEEIFRQSE